MSVRLVGDGLVFEQKYFQMLARFKNAEQGVSHNDIEAAMLLDLNFDNRVYDLLARKIRTVTEMDDEVGLEDLEFESKEIEIGEK
jgi:hypothetical protein